MNGYFLLKPFLFGMDAEKAHHLTMSWLPRLNNFSPSFLQRITSSGDFSLTGESFRCFGLDFSNRVGLAAGMDKNAEAVDAWATLGFGFVEIGTVTPRPQPGNEKPRLFRLPLDKALINRMGFNNHGADLIAHRLSKRKSNVIVGGNIGKNKETPNELAADDYLICFKRMRDVVDYFVVNVSSPNTPGLRALQDKESLMQILGQLNDENLRSGIKRPILLKIAPDMTHHQLDDIISLTHEGFMDGLIATNTTLSRDDLKTSVAVIESIGAGGLSGEPVGKHALGVLHYLRRNGVEQGFPIISSGGIMTAEDAIDRIKNGAQLIQLYTGLVYSGPSLITDVRKAVLTI